MSNKIILMIGGPATGKTTVGKILAKHFGLPYFSKDGVKQISIFRLFFIKWWLNNFSFYFLIPNNNKNIIINKCFLFQNISHTKPFIKKKVNPPTRIYLPNLLFENKFLSLVII